MSVPAALRTLLGARCIEDRERLRRYEIPERGEPGRTTAALLPQTEDEVGEILRICNAHGTALVLSGGRTGLVEAQRPEGELVLSLEKLDRPLAFELADSRRFLFPDNHDLEAQAAALLTWYHLQRDDGQEPDLAGASITAQAGMAVDTVNGLLGTLGRMWPMEMGSSSAASIGGCAANGSAGANAVCYGTAVHMTEAAWGFWGDGTAASPSVATPWRPLPPQVLAIDSASVRPEWGLLGTQGVLGVITHLKLRSFPIPAQREGVLVSVDHMAAVMAMLSAARTDFGADIEEFEFISRNAMQLVRDYRGDSFRSPLADDGSPYTVLLQVKSALPDENLAGRLYDLLTDTLRVSDQRIGYAPLPVLKAIRHSITEASNARMRALGGGRLSFDTATPLTQFGAYLSDLDREIHGASPDVEFITFGHAGVGGAHLHLLGTREHPVAPQADALTRLVFDITAAYGGTFSAEHGVGPKWGREFQRRSPAAVRKALWSAKKQHDPRGILSPRSFGLGRL